MKDGGFTFIYFSFYVISLLSAPVNSACTFPDDIRGNWISSEKGTLNITADTIWKYPLPVTAFVTETDLVCEEKNGDLYMLKSQTTFQLFGIDFYAYICFDLHVISSYKYWYQVANEIEPSTGQRIHAEVASKPPASLETACNRAEPFETATFNTLVKEGALEDGLIEATCPFDLFHTFSNGRLTSQDGMTSCVNTTLNVCSKRTQMRITYDPSCADSLKFAAEGLYVCLLDQTDATSGVTYLHVWNNDTTLANDVMRINCYAFEKSGDVMTATLYPGACLIGQTSTAVTDPGIQVQYNSIVDTCQDIVEGGPQTIYIVAIILGALVFIILIALIICVIKKTKCSCITRLCKKTKIAHSDASLMEEGEGSDAYLHSMRRVAKSNGGFVARKPIKLGPIIEPYLEPPPKVELLYDVEPRPTSSRLMFSRSLFLSQLSLRLRDDGKIVNIDIDK